jgi:acyl-CoA reductase LuxC
MSATSGASESHLRRPEQDAMHRGLLASDVASAAARLRAADSVAPSRAADVLSRAAGLWRDRNYSRRHDAIAQIARQAGYSVALFDESLDALLKPFSHAALSSLAEKVSSIDQADRPKLLGFIMAGNVAGAGLHEIAIGLVAGAGLLVKTASTEPVFFDQFAHTLADLDREVASRIAVFNWSRARDDLTAAMAANCDGVVAYGDDATIDSLRKKPAVIGFGSRVSGAVVAPGALAPGRIDATAEALACDVALFEQLGCLSLHHVFVVSRSAGAARDFAARIATALERLGDSIPPATIPLGDAVEILRVRERARWRRIAGESIELFEGPRLEWTVVFEAESMGDNSFMVSPGFRTVHVTGVRDEDEVRARLAATSGRIEAIAVAGDESETLRISTMLDALGVSYVAAPGEMQSPPLLWRHGGGAFLDIMVPSR